MSVKQMTKTPHSADPAGGRDVAGTPWGDCWGSHSVVIGRGSRCVQC